MKSLFWFRYFLLCFCFFIPALLPAEKPPLTINLFCELNRHGLSVDAAVLTEALTAQGYRVCRVDGKSREICYADINSFCEKIHAKQFTRAAKNWLIPNPEWFNQSLQDLNRIDLVLCRTKEVERIFTDLGARIYFLGFTTPDCHRSDVMKRADRYLHLAGNSPYKGTDAIIKAWQQSKAVPLCLSETEGFGHYISEAMSCGSVVVTTDAPPMNEFIEDPRFLVPYESVSTQGLATRYHVSPGSVETKMREITQLSPDELRAAGEANRQRYLEMKKNFEDNVEQLIYRIGF